MSAPEPVVLSWDWKEQPDLDELAEIVREMSGGTVHIRQVETHSDEYAIVIAPNELDAAVAYGIYERRWEDEDA